MVVWSTLYKNSPVTLSSQIDFACLKGNIFQVIQQAANHPLLQVDIIS